MPLSKRQLLQIRYRVIASYPGSWYEVGEILEYRPGSTGDIECAKHPKVFQKLYWWEERDKDEMPRYVKTSTGEVFQFIEAVKKFPDTAKVKTLTPPIVKCWRSFTSLQPASEHEHHIFVTYGLNPLPKLPLVELNIFNEKVENFKQENFMFKNLFLYGGISSWEQLNQNQKEDLFLHLECKPNL